MPSPFEILILVLTIAAAYYFIRLYKLRNASPEGALLTAAPTEGQQEEEEEYVSLGDMILAVSTKSELMDIALNYDLDVEDSAVFLKRAREFENELAPDDWAEIYEASEEGTELERVAEERAGDTLTPPEDDDR